MQLQLKTFCPPLAQCSFCNVHNDLPPELKDSDTSVKTSLSVAFRLQSGSKSTPRPRINRLADIAGLAGVCGNFWLFRPVPCALDSTCFWVFAHFAAFEHV